VSFGFLLYGIKYIIFALEGIISIEIVIFIIEN
jgi:hypothetical protein